MTTDNTTTDNTTTTDQAEPPELILAVLNEGKYTIDNMTIAGTGIDLKFIENVMRCNFNANDTEHHADNAFLFNFAKKTISDMVEYFIFHSIHSALTTYTGKSIIGKLFARHMEKETGMEVSFKNDKKNGCIEICFPHTREFSIDLKYPFIYVNALVIYNDKYNPHDAVEFRIWIKSILSTIAEKIKIIEPALNGLPEVISLRMKERKAKKKAFWESIKKRVPSV